MPAEERGLSSRRGSYGRRHILKRRKNPVCDPESE